MVLNPKDVAAAWRNKGLDFDPIAKWGLNKMFATSKDGIEKANRPHKYLALYLTHSQSFLLTLTDMVTCFTLYTPFGETLWLPDKR